MLIVVAGATAAVIVPGQEALDYGFRFASALDVDPKDKGKAQHAVAMGYADLGLLDDAVGRAEAIDGWRRGVALADLAVQLAQIGRTADARALLAKAEDVRRATPGWEGPRIAAHLAHAYAALGSAEPSQSIARDLARNDPRQYAGRSVAIEAGASAARGDYTHALAVLDSLDGDPDIEVAWWQTTGYLDLSRQIGLDDDRRRAAIDAARRSSGRLPDWKRAQILLEVAERYREIGSRDVAVEVIEAAEAIVESLDPTDESRPRALADVARAWSDLAEPQRARRVLSGAEAGVPRAPDIDRPALYAVVAASWQSVEDPGESRRLFDRAFEAAASLQNARPRALAVVEICRALGSARIPLDEATRRRLDALLAGLRAPW